MKEDWTDQIVRKIGKLWSGSLAQGNSLKSTLSIWEKGVRKKPSYNGTV